MTPPTTTSTSKPAASDDGPQKPALTPAAEAQTPAESSVKGTEPAQRTDVNGNVLAPDEAERVQKLEKIRDGDAARRAAEKMDTQKAVDDTLAAAERSAVSNPLEKKNRFPADKPIPQELIDNMSGAELRAIAADRGYDLGNVGKNLTRQAFTRAQSENKNLK